jgi:hypothetical protein
MNAAAVKEDEYALVEAWLVRRKLRSARSTSLLTARSPRPKTSVRNRLPGFGELADCRSHADRMRLSLPSLIRALDFGRCMRGPSAAINAQALSGTGMNLSKASLITLNQPSHVAQSQLQLDS